MRVMRPKPVPGVARSIQMSSIDGQSDAKRGDKIPQGASSTGSLGIWEASAGFPFMRANVVLPTKKERGYRDGPTPTPLHRTSTHTARDVALEIAS